MFFASYLWSGHLEHIGAGPLPPAAAGHLWEAGVGVGGGGADLGLEQRRLGAEVQVRDGGEADQLGLAVAALLLLTRHRRGDHVHIACLLTPGHQNICYSMLKYVGNITYKYLATVSSERVSCLRSAREAGSSVSTRWVGLT